MNEAAGIKYIEKGSGESKKTMVVFHGYGADASDLFSLAEALDEELKGRWIFPDGPMQIPLAPGFLGRAWFPIDERRLQAAAAGFDDYDFSHLYPPGLKEIREKMFEFLMDLKVEPENLVLGGFSQGAMLAFDICLHLPQQVSALLMFSNHLVDKEHCKALAINKKGQSFFQSHGEQDVVLRCRGGQQLYEILRQSGWQGSMHTFKGGHEIPMEIIHKAKAYLTPFL